MAFYAYADERREDEIWAENVNIGNRLDEYFCPTPNCIGRIVIRNIQGDRRPHFVTRPCCHIQIFVEIFVII